MELHITDYGTPQIVANHMFESAARATDLEPVLTAIIMDLMEVTKVNFTSEGHRGGGSWAQLKPDTIARKGHPVILIETGDLFHSVTELGAEHQILSIDPMIGFHFGTDRPHAYTHQYGSDARNIPARPFLRTVPSDNIKWRNMLMGYLVEPFK